MWRGLPVIEVPCFDSSSAIDVPDSSSEESWVYQAAETAIDWQGTCPASIEELHAMHRWAVDGDAAAALRAERIAALEDEDASRSLWRDQAKQLAKDMDLPWPVPETKHIVGRPTFDACYQDELLTYVKRVAAGQPRGILPPAKRPRWWKPSSGPRIWEVEEAAPAELAAEASAAIFHNLCSEPQPCASPTQPR